MKVSHGLYEGHVIRASNDYNHSKFENAMVEYLYGESLTGTWETSGCVNSPTGAFFRAGRWVVTESDSGFVDGHKFPDVVWAEKMFAAAEAVYEQWLEEYDEDELRHCRDYIQFLVAMCNAGVHSEDVLSYSDWLSEIMQALGKV